MHKQVFYEEPLTYGEIASRVNPLKMFTLGLAPTFMRNLVMLGVLQPVPADMPGYGSFIFALSFGSIVVSHPFEVLRVHI